jgi:Uma2 family endonuclease
MAWEDFLALHDKGEYVDGQYLPPDAMVTGRHQQIIARLTRLLPATGAHAFNEWGWRPDAAQRKYSPDVMLVSGSLFPDVDQQYWQGPVDLLVEVLSPTNESKDWLRNTHDYAVLGCPEYWIVSPWGRRIHLFRLVEGTYVLDQEITTTTVLDRWGLTLDVDALLDGP